MVFLVSNCPEDSLPFMAKWKRLLIDWFWPDTTTFLTKGRRDGMLYLISAVFVVIGGLICTLVFNHWIRSEIDPFMSSLVVRLESASQGNGVVSVSDLKNAAAALEICRREIKSAPTFYLPLLFLLCLVFFIANGILLLRAHQAVSAAVQDRPSKK